MLNCTNCGAKVTHESSDTLKVGLCPICGCDTLVHKKVELEEIEFKDEKIGQWNLTIANGIVIRVCRNGILIPLFSGHERV